MADPLIMVSRIASEDVLLVVSHHFKKHSSKPYGPANVVSCAKLFVFFLGVQDQGGEEREKHPHTCTEEMVCVNFTSEAGLLIKDQYRANLVSQARIAFSITHGA